jgi:hypothetical protein
MPEIDFDYNPMLYTDTTSGNKYYEIHRQKPLSQFDPTYEIKLAEISGLGMNSNAKYSEPKYERNEIVPLIPAEFVEPSDFGNIREELGTTDYVSGTKEYGFVIGIMAQVIDENGNQVIDENGAPLVAYEKAARSTIQYNTPPPFDTVDDKTTQLWIRGGDRPSGDNFTPGFPLSWNERDYSGIQLMHIENGHDWYWISWGVNETMYFHFLEGTTPSDGGANINDIQKNGPKDWAWGQAGWAFQHDAYILYPGSSLKFHNSGRDSSNTIDTPNGDDYGWPGFTGSR